MEFMYIMNSSPFMSTPMKFSSIQFYLYMELSAMGHFPEAALQKELNNLVLRLLNLPGW